MIAVADTSFIVAVSVATDKRHSDCLQVYQQFEKILILEAALAEIAFMLTRIGGMTATSFFLRGLPQAKRYKLAALEGQDFVRTAEILEKYANIDLDFVDASVTAVAERLNLTHILTLDRRDFQIIHPRHITSFEILPEN